MPGYFSYHEDHACRLCGDLVLPATLANKDDPINLALPDVCPGGAKVSAAVIIPQTQLWVHVGATNNIELIGCENEDACVSLETAGSNVTAWLAQSLALTPVQRRRLQAQPIERQQFSAHCGVGYKEPPNFICGKCAEGYVKIGGHCVECRAFDMSMLASSLAVYMILTPLFLLHKSTKLVVSKIEIRKCWNKVDTDGDGLLTLDDVKDVITLLDFVISEHAFAKLIDEIGVNDDGFVGVDDFVRYQSKSAPTAALQTATFFIQTFVLILKEAKFFGLAEALNLDLEASAGKCVTPLNTFQRFYTKLALTPTTLILGTILMCPVWNFLRRRLPHKIWDKVQSPQRITKTHVNRTFLNTFIFCYAPLTAAAIQMMICVKTCEAEECTRVMQSDFGVECPSNEQHIGTMVALATLIVFCGVIPAFLLYKAKTSVKARDASLDLRMTEVDVWWRELDADGSGSLEHGEIITLLKRMPGGDASEKAVRTIMFEIAQISASNSGSDAASLTSKDASSISKEHFRAWYHKQCKGMLQTPFDVLYGTTHDTAFWWWAQTMWLKTGINCLYSFGQAAHFSWHVWMHFLLAASVCLMINVKPYISAIDYQVELVAKLSLSVVAHLASLYTNGNTPGLAYFSLLLLLMVVPLLCLVGLKIMDVCNAKRGAKAAQAAVASGGATPQELGTPPGKGVRVVQVKPRTDRGIGSQATDGPVADADDVRPPETTTTSLVSGPSSETDTAGTFSWIRTTAATKVQSRWRASVRRTTSMASTELAASNKGNTELVVVPTPISPPLPSALSQDGVTPTREASVIAVHAPPTLNQRLATIQGLSSTKSADPVTHSVTQDIERGSIPTQDVDEMLALLRQGFTPLSKVQVMASLTEAHALAVDPHWLEEEWTKMRSSGRLIASARGGQETVDADAFETILSLAQGNVRNR
jgi:hypothetical protein